MIKVASRVPEVGTRWKHYRGGVYEIVAIALLEVDKEAYVVYKDAEGVCYTRPLATWNSKTTMGLARYIPVGN